MNIENSIMATKQGFEDSFSLGDYYNKQTQDGHHLKNILDFLPFKADMKILDLGTGSGYLSFSIARKYPNISIIGLDIVEKALEVNRFKAKDENVQNISFITYDGVNFPFDDNEFDMVISRYALHHFPDIQKSISEISRVIMFDQYFEKFFGIDTRVVEQIFFAYVGESVESRKNERPAERYEFL